FMARTSVTTTTCGSNTWRVGESIRRWRTRCTGKCWRCGSHPRICLQVRRIRCSLCCRCWPRVQSASVALTAITRAVRPSLNQCELGYLPRQPIDIPKAVLQHQAYETVLRELGARVISLPAEPDLPDSMFVEDPVVMVDEVAVMTRMGAESRRGESE